MANIPSTTVVFCEDKVALPQKAVLVVLKQIFQYGVEGITPKEDKVCVSLNYTPKAETLKRKIGNLSLRYMRTVLKSEDELNILDDVLKRYRFNTFDEDVEVEEGKWVVSKNQLQNVN